jgi:putative flippase GtrA
MKLNFYQIKQLLLLKTKYATTSLVATVVEYILYSVFKYFDMGIKLAQVLSYACGILVNFFLQKKYVFQLNRSLINAFLMAMIVSLGGMLLNYLIFTSVMRIDFFAQSHYDYLAKMIATACVFFYNFYLKRFVFEKRFFSVD